MALLVTWCRVGGRGARPGCASASRSGTGQRNLPCEGRGRCRSCARGAEVDAQAPPRATGGVHPGAVPRAPAVHGAAATRYQHLHEVNCGLAMPGSLVELAAPVLSPEQRGGVALVGGRRPGVAAARVLQRPQAGFEVVEGDPHRDDTLAHVGGVAVKGDGPAARWLAPDLVLQDLCAPRPTCKVGHPLAQGGAVHDRAEEPVTLPGIHELFHSWLTAWRLAARDLVRRHARVEDSAEHGLQSSGQSLTERRRQQLPHHGEAIRGKGIADTGGSWCMHQGLGARRPRRMRQQRRRLRGRGRGACGAACIASTSNGALHSCPFHAKGLLPAGGRPCRRLTLRHGADPRHPRTSWSGGVGGWW
mmetsp:Transcript_117756/g.327983  ORF Transcript_117756/g.327983 Transcript_117756/m.327983 type:complete len:361 (+) Transcript_117756:30-1112(+)